MGVTPHTEEVLEFDKIRRAIAEETVSALGRERVIERPVATDPETIEREYAFVAELYKLFEHNREPSLDGLCDIRPLLPKVAPQNALLEPAQLVEIADFCASVARARRFFSQNRDLAPLLAEQTARLILLHHLEYHIRDAIEPNGEVADNASPRLRELRGEIRALEARIQRTLERLMRALHEADILQDDFITQRQGRYVLPVKAGQKGKVQGIVHDASHSGETLFIEPFTIVEMTNDLTERRVEAREEVRRILRELCNMVRDDLDSLEFDLALMAELDERLARARFGWARGWVVPHWNDRRPLNLLGAYHPLLFLKSSHDAVPLDLPLKPDDRAVIISGPNAGGKTTALKTIGLLALMFQSSMPLPVHPNSNFRMFRNILADIGDEQDVTAGVSTFSSHVRRIAEILRVADESTLVLLDELGTATDPSEGGALAAAVVETLIERDSLTFVTSHLALLKSWAESHPRARNASFHLDPRTQRPNYKLRLDRPGVSEALIIAEQQGLDRSVIERAYALLPRGVYDVNKLLVSLEERERELEELLAKGRETEQKNAEIEKRLEAERAELESRRRKLKAEMLEEREKWLSDVRSRIEKRIAQLDSREEILDAKREIREEQENLKRERRALERLARKAPLSLDRLAPGSRVRVESLHDEGEVIAVDLRRGRLTVAVRNVEVELRPDQVVPLDPSPDSTGGVSGAVRVPARGFIPSDLGLHGLRVEEAIERVDKYLDQALLHNLESVRIRHGRGTGALRRAVHDFLRTHKAVRSFRLADVYDGGDGVTVVELK